MRGAFPLPLVCHSTQMDPNYSTLHVSMDRWYGLSITGLTFAYASEMFRFLCFTFHPEYCYLSFTSKEIATCILAYAAPKVLELFERSLQFSLCSKIVFSS